MIKIGKILAGTGALALSVSIALDVTTDTARAAGEEGSFYLEAQGFAHTRSGEDSLLGHIDESGPDPELRSDKLDYGYDNWGARARGGYYYRKGRAIELDGMASWTDGGKNFNCLSEASDGCDDDLDAFESGPDFLPSDGEFQDAVRFEFDHESELVSVALNHRMDINQNASWFYGARYVYVSEDFRLKSFDDESANVVDPSDDVGILHFDTSNHMIGMQIGGRVAQPLTQSVSIGATGALGVFANVSKSDFRYFEDITEGSP